MYTEIEKQILITVTHHCSYTCRIKVRGFRGLYLSSKSLMLFINTGIVEGIHGSTICYSENDYMHADRGNA